MCRRTQVQPNLDLWSDFFSPLVSSAVDVHEKCGRSGNVREVRLARVGMAVLVAPFSLFRFFWARKRNENRKHWMQPTKTSRRMLAKRSQQNRTLYFDSRKQHLNLALLPAIFLREDFSRKLIFEK
jgi:hypothetical protein